MKLLRLALLRLEKAGGPYSPIVFNVEGIEVHVNEECFRDDSLRIRKIPLIAIAELAERPKIIDKGIELSEDIRRQAERAIEHIANCIAISEKCSRSIWSPNPCVALIPENEDERTFLDKTEGIIHGSHGHILMELGVQIPPELLNRLVDRLDGVALLAEALSSQHATGKYHEIVRLFERAFGLSVTQAEKKISQFLSGNGQGFTREEVKEWIKLRNPATHALTGDDFVTESSVSRVIHRMEQAAYDVLFNKAKWRDKSSERIAVFSPTIASADSSHKKAIALPGAQTTPSAVFMDGFNVFKIDPEVSIDTHPPDWWTKAKYKPS